MFVLFSMHVFLLPVPLYQYTWLSALLQLQLQAITVVSLCVRACAACVCVRVCVSERV